MLGNDMSVSMVIANNIHHGPHGVQGRSSGLVELVEQLCSGSVLRPQQSLRWSRGPLLAVPMLGVRVLWV